jgi:hypothetical protein
MRVIGAVWPNPTQEISMRAKAMPFVVLALLTLPAAASAQLGVGVRAGTTGLGADVGISLSPTIMLRGGLGIQPVNPKMTLSDIDFEVNLPGSFGQVGIALLPSGGGLRLEGGLLYKPDDTTINGTFTTNQEFNGQSYTPAQIGTISGTAASEKTWAPYAMLGFGKISSAGIGLYLDLGAAFVGTSDLTVVSNGLYANNAQFKADLAAQEQKWEDDINKYKIYPMVNLGLRIGFGG